jgi:Na+-driven multidrug efflux pump
MIVSGSLNIILNFILCLILEQKVAAVAIATAISQIVGAILVLHRITTMKNDCRLKFKAKNWSTPIFKKLLTNGLPIGFSSSLYSLANLQIQSSLNLFGADAIAGSSAGSNLESIEASIVSSPWSAAVSVFVGQNVGADNKKRVKHSILICGGLAIGFTILISAFIYLFRDPVISLFVDSRAAVEYGMIRVKYLILPYTIATTTGILTHSMQAFGYSIFSTLNSTVNVLIFRVIWMTFIYPLCPTFAVLMQCFLVSWILVLICNLAFFFYVYYKKFKAGKLKKMG